MDIDFNRKQNIFYMVLLILPICLLCLILGIFGVTGIFSSTTQQKQDQKYLGVSGLCCSSSSCFIMLIFLVLFVTKLGNFLE